MKKTVSKCNYCWTRWKTTTTCRKWRITGRSNRLFAALSALALFFAFLAPPARADDALSLRTTGFSIRFSEDVDYYLCEPADFRCCSIDGFTGAKALSVEIEQYASARLDYEPGSGWMELGYGRAKVHLTFTMANGAEKEYLIAFADPDSVYYCYARTAERNVEVKESPSPHAKTATTLIEKGTRVYYTGMENGWFRVQRLYHSEVGYIAPGKLSVNWPETGMAARYYEALKALREKHPNWTFSFLNVGKTRSEALAGEPAKAATYLDPLYYLTEEKIYAFLDLHYTGWYDREGVGAIWVNERAYSKDEIATYVLHASESLKMNAYYITCRLALESGYGTSSLSKGTVPGYEGYYNFYGIGAYDSNPNNGAVYAKNRGWNSPFRAIVEGANWIKDQYVDQGSITPYFFRFSSINGKSYMTDVTAPEQEASILRRYYKNANEALRFIIPVYTDDALYTANGFTDLDPFSWYFEEVISANNAGLFVGTSAQTFTPEATMTRAEFVAVVARLCGADVSNYNKTSFRDVGSAKWYYHDVCWAEATGVTAGTSPGFFSPTLTITREQMCTMLAEALEKVLKVSFPANGKAYADQAEISDWALSAVRKCSAAGLFVGDASNRFLPKNNAKRCEAACVFYRTYQKYAE